jgi:hypothetical protein
MVNLSMCAPLGMGKRYSPSRTESFGLKNSWSTFVVAFWPSIETSTLWKATSRGAKTGCGRQYGFGAGGRGKGGGLRMMIKPSASATTEVARKASTSRSFVFIVLSKRAHRRCDVIAA